MKTLRSFNIPIHGLKTGVHHYDFDVDDDFFACFENSEIENGTGKVAVELEKKPAMLEMKMEIEGMVRVPCDRCGSDMDQEVSSNRTLFFKFGEERSEQSDEMIILGEQDHELDVSQFIYEFFHLALPVKRIHLEGDCDEEAIRILEEHNSENSGNEGSADDNIDPRWEKLRNLQNGSGR